MLRATAGKETTAPTQRTGSIGAVMAALRRIGRELRLGARDAKSGAGIGGAQLLVLETLAEEPASSLNDLAERTLTDQSSASVVVRRLAERKLIARRESRLDSRRVELSITSAGRGLLARCPGPTPARLVRALRRLPPGELAKLNASLASLLREIGIEEATPPNSFADDVRVRSPGSRADVAALDGQSSRRRN